MQRWPSWAGILPLLALAAVAGGCLPQSEASRVIEQTLVVGGVPTVTIDVDNGQVVYQGREGLSELHVRATLRAWADSEQRAERLLDEIPFSIEQQGDTVTIRQSPKGFLVVGVAPVLRVDVEVEGPVLAQLVVTTDNGDVRAEDVEGGLQIASDNGGITLVGVRGDLVLETDNGNIAVEDASASLQARTDNGNVAFSGSLVGDAHRVETDNGNIVVALPADAALQIDAQTDNGTIRTDLPLTGELREKRVLAILNFPQATLTLRTDNGDIRIEAQPQ